MDQALREKVLAFLLEMYTSAELSEWLRALGADTRGTVDEKKERIRQHTKFFSMSTDKVLDQLIPSLLDSDVEWTEDLCRDFGLSLDGSKPLLVRRVHRYIALREGQLPPTPPNLPGSRSPTIGKVHPIVAWYPVYRRRTYEKDHYGEFRETMVDIFGETRCTSRCPSLTGAP